MSECSRVMERLLAVDVDDLEASGDGELVRHLSACDRCTGALERIRAANAALDRAMGGMPPLDASAIVARARLEALPSDDPEASSDAASETDPSRRRHLPHWRKWLAVGAAASIGTLLLLSERQAPLPGARIDSRPEAPVVVDAPSDRNVAVIQTENPDITVLWFF